MNKIIQNKRHDTEMCLNLALIVIYVGLLHVLVFDDQVFDAIADFRTG